MNSKHNVVDALQWQHLYAFVWEAFQLLHPGQDFVPAKYLEAICHVLEKVAAGDIRRLVITVPPRYGKSITTSVAFVAWLLGRFPSKKIMVASYGSDLGQKHARDFRNLVRSDPFRRLFPALELTTDRLEEQITATGGGRKAVTVGGPVTGFGADIIIVDDPIKAIDAASPIERQNVRDWFEGTLLSRLNDKQKGAVVVIQQRLHEDDLPGSLLATGQYHHLDLPAIAVRDEDIDIGPGRIWRRRKDDVLCPAREPLETLERIRVEMGNAAFSAQYQQDPTPPGGNRIQWKWFGQYDAADIDRDSFLHVVQSWDTAMTGEPTSDFSVGTTWGYRDKKWHLLDLVRRRLDFPDLKRAVASEATRWRANHVLIELAGTGYSLLQQLRSDHPDMELLSTSPPRISKEERVEAQSARLETGDYLLPDAAPWLDELRRELLAFPSGKYDDQVDSVFQFVAWSAGRQADAMYRRDPVTGRLRRPERPRSNRRQQQERQRETELEKEREMERELAAAAAALPPPPCIRREPLTTRRPRRPDE